MTKYAKRYGWYWALILVGLVIGFIIFRHFNPSLGFGYFEPSYLPPHTSIKAKRINITRGDIKVEQNFRTEDWVYSIREYKSRDVVGTTVQNYDPKSLRPTCDTRSTPLRNLYRICHWIDYGKIDVHEAKFIKAGTFIAAQIPTTLNNSISLQQIDKFVDSFKPRSPTGFSVLHSNGP